MTPSLTCDSCGSGNAVPSPWEETLCPSCVISHATAQAAGDHLKVLLRASLEEWLTTWSAHPELTRQLHDQVPQTAAQIVAELRLQEARA